MTAPHDAAARATIADSLDDTLFVSAGAGTGKSTALVGRIVRLALRPGMDMSALAAITFTEPAAAELRDKVREALERAAAGLDVVGAGPGASVLVATPDEQRRAADALRDLDQATVTTLHGFCQRLLNTHAIEADLPPRFTILTDQPASLAFDTAWGEYLQHLLTDDALAEVLVRASALGITVTNLREIADELNGNWDLVAAHTPPPRGPVTPIDTSDLCSLLTAAIDLGSRCTDGADKLLGHLEKLTPVRGALVAASSTLDVLNQLASAPTITSSLGTQGNWGGKDGKQEVTSALKAAANCFTELMASLVDDTINRLVDGLCSFVLEQAVRRRRAGTLTFHDLLVHARDLLRDNADVCDELHERFHHLLIDEFQDTDPIQAEVAFRIAGTGPPEQPWGARTVEPGRLFFVGDPKQAIYRFRRADIALYLHVQHLLGDAPVSLTTCFRSVPAIIDWVNAAFETFFDGSTETSADTGTNVDTATVETAPRTQPRFEALHCHRRPASNPHDDAPPAVLALGGPVKDDERGNTSTGFVRNAAAEDLATTINRAVAEGWRVDMDRPGISADGLPGRPLRFRDIAILYPTGAQLPELTASLDNADIPYRLRANADLYKTPEIADLIRLLRAVANPSDELAVVAALRSPLLACADDELVTWKRAAGSWNYLDTSSAGKCEAAPSVEAALTELSSLHHEARWCTPSELVETILTRRQVLALHLLDRRPRDAWRRIRWFADQARAFTEDGGGSLHDWLRWLDLATADSNRVKEVIVDESDDDAVQLLTMHSSKGLEFPFVAIAGLSAAMRDPSGVDVLWSDGTPEVHVRSKPTTGGYATETTGYGAVREREKVIAAEEDVRLLYVAATRARDFLVLPLHHAPSAKGTNSSWAGKFWDRRDEFADLWTLLETREAPAPNTAASTRPDVSAAGELIGSPDDLAAWTAARSETLMRAATPLVLAPTSLAALLAAPQPTDDADGLPIDADADGTTHTHVAPGRRGRGGTSLGRAVHGVLQLVDLAAPSDSQLTDLARTQAALEGLPSRAREVQELARHALESPTVASAAHTRHWRELYVALPIADRLLEGFVDLLVDAPDGYTVVDYKTALGATPEQLHERAAGYRLQAVAYSLMVTRLTGRPVKRATFVFLHEGGATEIDVPNLPDAVAELEATLQQVR